MSLFVLFVFFYHTSFLFIIKYFTFFTFYEYKLAWSMKCIVYLNAFFSIYLECQQCLFLYLTDYLLTLLCLNVVIIFCFDYELQYQFCKTECRDSLYYKLFLPYFSCHFTSHFPIWSRCYVNFYVTWHLIMFFYYKCKPLDVTDDEWKYCGLCACKTVCHSISFFMNLCFSTIELLYFSINLDHYTQQLCLFCNMTFYSNIFPDISAMLWSVSLFMFCERDKSTIHNDELIHVILFKYLLIFYSSWYYLCPVLLPTPLLHVDALLIFCHTTSYMIIFFLISVACFMINPSIYVILAGL